MKNKTVSGRNQDQIAGMYRRLEAGWGRQHWWPAQTPFEVIVGAILTQNTAWSNVEKALANLRMSGKLSTDGIRSASMTDLERLIRPAGYFRQKAKRLKTFVAWIDENYAGSLKRMFARHTEQLRSELLAINGIGPETADSILLYAGQHEIFVVDAYTRRIFERHRLIRAGVKYDEIREMVEDALHSAHHSAQNSLPVVTPTSVERGPGPVEEVLTPVVHLPSAMSEAPRSPLAQRYSEFHALLVQVAKHYCLSRVARCELCPLQVFLASRRPLLQSNEKGKKGRSRRKSGRS